MTPRQLAAMAVGALALWTLVALLAVAACRAWTT